MGTRRILAAVLSLCMLGGTFSYSAPALKSIATAPRVSKSYYYFNTETGTLTLKENVDCNGIADFAYKTYVKTIVAKEGTVFPRSCWKMFYNYSNCEKINLSNVDTSKVIDMSYMFFGVPA